MSPDELRNLAATVEFSGAKDQRGEYADAAGELRKFADVIEHAERESSWASMQRENRMWVKLQKLLRLARGETNEREGL